MHLRRALLLFAIVIGLAAVAASLSRSGDGDREPPPSGQPTIAPGSAGEPPVALRFDAEREQTRRLEVGLAATVEVEVDEPGQVEIPLLDLAAPAEPVTPARFDVFASDVRRYPITFTPAGADESRPAGTLAVTPARG